MVKQLPPPYMLDVEGEVPNTYMVGLGAGYVAARAGDILVADTNAFQAYLSQFESKTGLKFNKGIFGHDVFRRVFIVTLSSMYSAYSSARSQYLSSAGISDSDLPQYTTADDTFLALEFLANDKSELEEILSKNEDVNEAIRAFITKRLFKLDEEGATKTGYSYATGPTYLTYDNLDYTTTTQPPNPTAGVLSNPIIT